MAATPSTYIHGVEFVGLTLSPEPSCYRDESLQFSKLHMFSFDPPNVDKKKKKKLNSTLLFISHQVFPIIKSFPDPYQNPYVVGSVVMGTLIISKANKEPYLSRHCVYLIAIGILIIPSHPQQYGNAHSVRSPVTSVCCALLRVSS